MKGHRMDQNIPNKQVCLPKCKGIFKDNIEKQDEKGKAHLAFNTSKE